MTDPLDEFGNTARDFASCSDDLLESQRRLVRALSASNDPEQQRILHSQLDQLADLQQRLRSIGSRLQVSDEQLRKALSEARTDPLTELPNRRAFDEALAANLKRVDESDASAFLALIDVDFFKLINDEKGHLAGDQVLIGVAQTLTSILGDHGFVARYGGDEFAILSNHSEAEFIDVLENVRRVIADQSTESSDSQHPIDQATISVGICSLNEFQRSTDAVELADAALLQAKRSGKNRICVNNRDSIAEILPRTP